MSKKNETIKKETKKRAKPRAFYRFMKFTFGWIFRLLYGMRVRGKENEPVGKNFVIIANHTSLMDVVPLAIALKTQIRFMAKKEIFKVPILRGFVKGMGGFPVDRKKGDVSAIKKTIEILKDDYGCVGIFPQGTRCPYEDPRKTPIKDGCSMVALKAGVGILPVAIKTKKSKLRLFRRTEIVIGECIDTGAIELQGEALREQYTYLTGYAFDKVCTMLESEAPKKLKGKEEKSLLEEAKSSEEQK